MNMLFICIKKNIYIHTDIYTNQTFLYGSDSARN
jgi:hypothetical protein